LSRQRIKRNTDIEIIGERVALRPWRQDDIAAVEAWYDEAARTDLNDGRLAITLPGEDTPIGIIHYRADYPGTGWLTIGCVGLAPALRVRGYGSEAVLLLEEQALRLGLASRFRAQVEPSNGLALYFWLRLGYRPVAAGGIITMIHDHDR